MSGDQNAGIGLSFIDILFAFVVGFGLDNVKDKPWVSDFLHNWTNRDLWMFVLGNAVVVGSWIGYHKVMMGLDREVNTWQSLLRFVVDVILLFVYFRLLANIDNPRLVFAIIFQIFFWYVIWDAIVRTEGAVGREVVKDPILTIFWFAIYGVTYLVALNVPWTKYESTEWLILATMGILWTFLYRLHWLPW